MAEPSPIDYARPDLNVRRPIARNLFGWVLFIGLAIMLFLIMTSKQRKTTTIALSEFSEQLDVGNVDEVTLDGDVLRGTFRNAVTMGGPSKVSTFRTDIPTGSAPWEVAHWLIDKGRIRGTTVRVENSGSLLTQTLASIAPWLIVLGFVWLFILRPARSHIAGGRAQTPMPVVIVNPPNPAEDRR